MIPKSIQIGPIVYDVCQVEDLKPDEVALVACVDHDNGQILLDRNYSASPLVPIFLLHECLHAILAHSGRSDHDEGLIDCLAFGIYDLLQNNSLVSWGPDEKSELSAAA